MKSKRGRPVGTHKGLFPTSVSGKQTMLYRKWQSMLARCYQPSHHSFPHYHRKGITVCESWRGPQGFQAFALAMGECPPGLTLERINNQLGYSPENCRWATWKEQADNREHKGAPVNPSSLKQKAKAAGLPYMVVYQRIKIHGWTEERALATPKGRQGRLSFVDSMTAGENAFPPLNASSKPRG